MRSKTLSLLLLYSVGAFFLYVLEEKLPFITPDSSLFLSFFLLLLLLCSPLFRFPTSSSSSSNSLLRPTPLIRTDPYVLDPSVLPFCFISFSYPLLHFH